MEVWVKNNKLHFVLIITFSHLVNVSRGEQKTKEELHWTKVTKGGETKLSNVFICSPRFYRAIACFKVNHVCIAHLGTETVHKSYVSGTSEAFYFFGRHGFIFSDEEIKF